MSLKENKGKLIGRFLFAVGAIMIAVVMICTFFAVKGMNSDYNEIKNHDIGKDGSLSIRYDDHIYASIGSGIVIDHREEDVEGKKSSFLTSALKNIDNRIVSCTILYTMMTVTVSAYPLYRKFGKNKTVHTFSTIITTIILFAAFLLFAFACHRAFRLPFFFPTGKDAMIAAASLSAVIGGSCLLSLLIRTVRIKIITAFAAIPIVFLLFIFGTMIEGQLYSTPTVDSFDYIREVDEHVFDEDYDGEVYYDDEKNVVVLNGKEYGPQKVDNPEHLRGAARIGAYVFELISPYSGNGLFLIYEGITSTGSELTISPVISMLYILKAAALAALSLSLGKKRDNTN